MQIKSMITSHIHKDDYNQRDRPITNIGQDIEKLKSSNIDNENLKWYIHFGKQFGISSKSWTELPYDPAISHVGVQPREQKT